MASMYSGEATMEMEIDDDPGIDEDVSTPVLNSSYSHSNLETTSEDCFSETKVIEQNNNFSRSDGYHAVGSSKPNKYSVRELEVDDLPPYRPVSLFVKLLEEEIPQQITKINDRNHFREAYFKKHKESAVRTRRRIQEIWEEKQEEIRLKEENKKLKQMVQEKEAKYAEELKRFDVEFKKQLESLDHVERKLRKEEQKLKVAEKQKKRAVKNNKIVREVLAETERNRDQLRVWLENHGIGIIILDDDDEEEEVQQENLNREGESAVLMQFTNIVSHEPEKIFSVELSKYVFEEKKFVVKTVVPSFEGAYELVAEANSSQNFVRFIIECRKHWIENSASNTLVQCEKSMRRSLRLSERSAALFESPEKSQSLDDPPE